MSKSLKKSAESVLIRCSVRCRMDCNIVHLSATVICLALLYPADMHAKPVNADQAALVAKGFTERAKKPFGAAIGNKVARTETYFSPSGEPLYHVVFMDSSGFIIVPADDLVEPIIAICSGNEYDPSADNPFGALVSNDLRGRMDLAKGLQTAAQRSGLPLEQKIRVGNIVKRWDKLCQDIEPIPTDNPASISDIRVAPLVQSKWNQATAGGYACYNYYTPPYTPGTTANYPCGCVATAMSQLMRFHEHPAAGVGTASFAISVDGTNVYRNLRGGDGLGGSYDWSEMTLVPSEGTTLAQRQAIGSLCHDAGVAVQMSYTANSSGSEAMQAAAALKSVFDYDNAVAGWNGENNFPASALRGMINPMLDSKRPMLLGITGIWGGHAIVCDGYGYSGGTMYHHLNMGWAGSSDTWYNLPNIESSPSFSSVYKTVYNVYVTGSGEIISGRVADELDQPIDNVEITAYRTGGGVYTATTDSNGIYALAKIPSSSIYRIGASKTGYNFEEQTASTGLSALYGATAGNVWGVNFTNQPPLYITPASGLKADGLPGGPFSTSNITYTLLNTTSSNLSWVATCPSAWITTTPWSGTLAGGASDEVTVSINSNTEALAVGTYTNVITFSNTATGVTQQRLIKLSIREAAALPFAEDFENGLLDTWWESTGTADFRTEVTAANYPHVGNHLTMDVSVSGSSYSRNELTLLINLAGRENVMLSFWAMEFSDEAHGPPTSPFIDGADFDGVAISEDGTIWYEIQSLRGLSSTYEQFEIDLDAAIAACGLTYNPLFRIRFNHYDDYSISTDGIAIDDIQIYEAPPMLRHFEWNTITSPQQAGRSFDVQITATDQSDALFEAFTGSVDLSAIAHNSITGAIQVGTGTTDWVHPMSTYYHDARTQVIYLDSEIGSSCSVTSLALNVAALPGQMLKNWTVRMRHTTLNSYGENPSWENDWSTVYQSDTVIASTGWTVFELDAPFEYNGTDNLMIDFSYNNNSYTRYGSCLATTMGISRSLYYRTDSGYGDPLNWSGTSSPAPNQSFNYPNIILGISGLSEPISLLSTTTGNFTAGIWSGSITIPVVATNVILIADDSTGHRGYSKPFNVVAAADDDDGDGIPDWWEILYFGHPSNCVWDALCANGMNNMLEAYIAGICPTNPTACFTITNCIPLDSGFMIEWPSVSGRVYRTLWTDNLTNGFQTLESNILYPRNSCTDTVHGAANSMYYQVEVEIQ